MCIIPATTCPCVGNVCMHNMLACLCLPAWRCVPWSLSIYIDVWISSSGIRLLKFLLPSKQGITREVSPPSLCVTMRSTMHCAITYDRTTSKLMGEMEKRVLWYQLKLEKHCRHFNWMLQFWWWLKHSVEMSARFSELKLVSENTLFRSCRSQLRSNHFNLMGGIDGKSVWWCHRYCGDNNYIIMPSYMMASTIIGW